VRVAHLTSLHQPEDVRIFHKECRSLARAGYEVHLVAPAAAGGTRDGVVRHGFAPPGGPRPLRIARRLWRVWRAARQLRASIYHIHEPELVPVALLLKRAGARVVYDVHEDHPKTQIYEPYRFGKRTGFRLLEALARRACDGFVAATPAIARSLPPKRTVAVRNLPLLEELPAHPRPAENGRADVVYVGGLTYPRGLREMVEAARRLSYPEARLVLVGPFGAPEIERAAPSLPGWERVEHVGQVEHREVWRRLAGARVGLVILHPEESYLESLPTKLFEYMAAGLPVIVSDFPFFRALLEPIGCALFVDPLDPGQIADAVDSLLADPARARAMGERGAAAVRERLNWQAEEPRLLELYRRLAPGATDPR
jgi:glycosyltransferase involved in cell wall biosynthesis